MLRVAVVAADVEVGVGVGAGAGVGAGVVVAREGWLVGCKDSNSSQDECSGLGLSSFPRIVYLCVDLCNVIHFGFWCGAAGAANSCCFLFLSEFLGFWVFFFSRNFAE
jgi:hypothetical protein